MFWIVDLDFKCFTGPGLHKSSNIYLVNCTIYLAEGRTCLQQGTFCKKKISQSAPLDELLEPPKPTIELKPLPSGLRYAFLNNGQDSPVIISDKLSQEESLCMLTVLEKHRSSFGYSLQDLKGISPGLCTHRIPTDPNSIPTRDPVTPSVLHYKIFC